MHFFYKSLHFGGQIFDSKMGSSRMMFFGAGALSKTVSASKSDRFIDVFGCACDFGHHSDSCGQAHSCELCAF